MRFKNIYNFKKYQINIFLMNLRDFDILISKINKKLFLNIFKKKYSTPYYQTLYF